MGTPFRNCKGQPKSVGWFEARSEVPFVLKECNYIDWDTLELIYGYQTIILTTLILLYGLKNTMPMPTLVYIQDYCQVK